MNQSKNKITSVTYAGILPFYLSPMSHYLNRNGTLPIFSEFETISSLYAALIVCFLSGMQWQKLIEINMKGIFFFIPFIPLFLVSTHTFNDSEVYGACILILSLFLSLLIDLILSHKKSDEWFKKLRINATVLASISFLI